jgi:hypothetical protein
MVIGCPFTSCGLWRRGLASVIYGKIRKMTNSDFSAYFMQFLKSLLLCSNGKNDSKNADCVLGINHSGVISP